MVAWQETECNGILLSSLLLASVVPYFAIGLHLAVAKKSSSLQSSVNVSVYVSVQISPCNIPDANLHISSISSLVAPSQVHSFIGCLATSSLNHNQGDGSQEENYFGSVHSWWLETLYIFPCDSRVRNPGILNACRNVFIYVSSVSPWLRTTSVTHMHGICKR